MKHWPVDCLYVFMTVLSPSRAIKTLFYFFKPGCSVLHIALNNINGILGFLLRCFVTDKPAGHRKK